MARVTVEDCLEREENRFALVVLAAQRTRQIMKGNPPLVAGKNKASVMALREIAAGKVHFHRATQTVVEEWIAQSLAAGIRLLATRRFMQRSPRVGGAFSEKALARGSSAHYADVPYYDKTYGGRDEDVAFYQSLVRAKRGATKRSLRILEIGIGSGRIALPLAREGAAITGIDLSAPMLAELARRRSAEPPDVQKRLCAYEHDMRELGTLDLGAPFPLILCTFNTFLHLYTRDDVERFLAGVRAHLAPGGRFVMDVSVPHPEDLARDPDRAFSAPRYRDPSTGKMVKYAERFEYDAASQVLFVSMEMTPVDGSAPWGQVLAHRQFFPQEIEALFHYNGLSLVSVEGGFEGEPLDRFSDLSVWTFAPSAKATKATKALARR